MELKELLLKGSQAIRRDATLTGFFIEYYESIFNTTPQCYGCNWNKVYNNLYNHVFKQENTIMKQDTNKTFRLKKGVKNDILTYYKNNKPYRIYANSANDNFVREFLKYGTEEEIAKRLEMFEKLPDAVKEVKVESTQITLEDAIAEVEKAAPKKTRKRK